jgi:hypothetical protein
MVVHHVLTVNLLAPFVEFALDDGPGLLWDEDVERKCGACQFALVCAVAPELEDRIGFPGDDIVAADARGLRHGWLVGDLRMFRRDWKE